LGLTKGIWTRCTVRPAAIAVMFCVVLAGCQAIPGDGPWMGGAQSESTEALPFQVLDLTPTSVGPYRPVTNVDRATGIGNVGYGSRIAVAAGDAIKVRIFEPYEGNIFPTLTRPGADLGIQRVSDDGTITVPFIGSVQVAGLDLPQIERRIAGMIGSRAQDPQVIVEFVADRTHTVLVAGDVKTPGRVSMLEGVRSVGDAINRAGGPSKPESATQVEVMVRRDGQVILVTQYNELLAGADIPIRKGDEIVLRPNSRSFTAIGAVQKAGNHDINRVGMNLMEALGSVGGLTDERANKTGVFVFRLTEPPGKSMVFRLDLHQPQSIFVAQQFGIQPKDVVYVTNAPLHEYNKVLLSIYRTFSVVGVVRGTVTPSTTF
jgi:polysaccharide export outer membrane protein